MSSADSTYGSSPGQSPRMATHDISRVSYHVKHLDSFAQTLEDSANRAFPNRGRSSQRYKKVQALLLHWGSDDLFVLPELEDLERCLREEYAYDTEIFPIPSENSHLELMMQVGKLIKDHEAQDTLFLVYYGGHARIDESRQSTWCATRNPDSPWLQWSAIQTLLERSASDCLILLDCCAGAASATFPNGNSITETISASSWDAIAPDPGRYSFTNALIEVMQEWRMRTFSAAMLHAEVLARLKHPRPITINGKLFEARSTPVHFMMTSNHKAPSIEISRILPPGARPPSPPQDASVENDGPPEVTGGRGPGAPVSAEPNEDTPHVMISLALEDDQQLDLNAWEQWLSSFPALAKYVKVQGVYKSHSTLLLVSMPVMIWDLLPEDHATSFVAFIRSNNLMTQKGRKNAPLDLIERAFPDAASRQKFGQWQSTTCMAVYSRAVDSTWECPLADLLYQKFKSWGWLGRCFVLKGHYREFSVSYSASLAGSRNPRSIINNAHDDPRTSESTQNLAYETLLGQIDSEEGRLNPSAPGSMASSDRARAATQHEQNLETEFRRRVPDLYRKALDVGASSSPAAPLPPSSGPGFGQSDPDDDPSLPPATRVCSDGSGEASSTSTTIPSSSLLRTPDVTTKLHLVEYLDRGLAHIRQGLPDSQISCPSPAAGVAVHTNTNTTTSLSPGLSKLAADGYFDAYPSSSTSLPPPPTQASSATMTTTTGPCPSDDSYVKISRGDALQLGDPGASGTTGTSITTAAAAATATPAAASKDGTRDVTVTYGDETPRRGRGGFLNKVLRRA
ncbi:hypothetical protein CTRI78_v001746 [Colletotrichum trifolii]|uniref:Tyrosine-protein phosphatase non-receptor type 6 n=1 Tax=Colletotrichum trifolii TaxID=5466 RepID=A0A4R8RNJ9_COLTR|nr:hypothetical protein CTRI78_v001746 [Colletotrichum trifolii]